MTEDLKEEPPSIEDKQSVIDYIENSSLEIEHIESAECKEKILECQIWKTSKALFSSYLNTINLFLNYFYVFEIIN